MEQPHSPAVTSTGTGSAAAGTIRPTRDANFAVSRLGRGIEICLALAIAIPPFVFGGREAVGQLLLALLVLLASGLWIIRRGIQGPQFIPLGRAEIFLVLAALALLVISWIPLPVGLVRGVAPGIGRLLPGWQTGTLGALSNGGWRTLSLTPGSTIEGAFLLLLYALLFWITLDVVRTRESARRLLVTLFVAGIGVACVGLLNYVFWNGKFYGLWSLWWVDPDRQVRAPFTNRNHFAGFLALAIAPGILTLLGLFRRWKRTPSFESTAGVGPWRPHDLVVLSAGLGLIAIFAGLFLSQSRGGTIVGVLAIAATTAGLLRGGINRASSLALMALLVISGVGVVVAMAGREPFQRSTALLTDNQSLDQLSNQRFRLWQADLQALGDFPLFGTGAGSHAQVYPLYLENASHVTFTHAESGYVQVLVECGLAGGILLLLAVCFLSRCCWRGLRAEGQSRERSSPAIVLALSVSLLVALIHGVVDFVWYVPAYAAAVAVLAGLACSAYRHRAFSSAKRGATRAPAGPRAARWAWGLVLIGSWAIASLIVARHFVHQVYAQDAWNAYFELLPETGEEDSIPSDIANTRERADFLAHACRWGNADSDHYYRLGLTNLELFLQQQRGSTFTLAEARTYLQAREFSDPAVARAWLEKLYGVDLELLETAQASFRRSLECCPLNGQAYVRLAQLCFLDAAQPKDAELFCRQALLVRPNDPDVHLQVGLEDWTMGDLPSARLCWAKACGWRPDCRWKVLPIVAEQLPAEQAADFLPRDFEGLKWLARNQLALGRKNGLGHVVEQAQKAVEADPELAKSASAWLAVHELYRDAGLDDAAEACLRQALQRAPREAGYQLRLIQWQMARGRWDDALEQAQTARRSFPQNAELHNLVRRILAMKEAAPAPKKPGVHSASKPP
jgi:O-antigen ligase/tetratricopeptide (TPR) repeat protein